LPPLLSTNNIELKIELMISSEEFNITGDLEMDNGHAFTSQIKELFMTYFQNQVMKLQFDFYDPFPRVEDALAAVNKKRQLSLMNKYEENERKKSKIGSIRPDQVNLNT
jgi:hypothetical protein